MADQLSADQAEQLVATPVEGEVFAPGPTQRSGDVHLDRPLGQSCEAGGGVDGEGQPQVCSKNSVSQPAWRTTERKASGSSSASRSGLTSRDLAATDRSEAR